MAVGADTSQTTENPKLVVITAGSSSVQCIASVAKVTKTVAAVKWNRSTILVLPLPRPLACYTAAASLYEGLSQPNVGLEQDTWTGVQ